MRYVVCTVCSDSSDGTTVGARRETRGGAMAGEQLCGVQVAHDGAQVPRGHRAPANH